MLPASVFHGVVCCVTHLYCRKYLNRDLLDLKDSPIESLQLIHQVIVQTTLLNKEQSVQVSDTTKVQ
jgi:hypothetical protein